MDWRAELVAVGMRLRGGKRRMQSARRTRQHVDELTVRPKSYSPPARVAKAVAIDVREAGGARVYDLSPPGGGAVDRAVLYLHGGAYTYEIESVHWQFVSYLARKVPARVTVPIYPLAPIATAERTVAAMVALLAELIDGFGPGNVSVMGDSAGGGLSLAVAQQLRDTGAPQPRRIVLISPWLDVTMSDARQPAIEPRDHLLGIDGLAECGRLYAGSLDLRDPRVSPLYGDLAGLAPIDVYAGTDDLLFPDSERLVERCREAGGAITLHRAEGMQHVYPLLPLIEAGATARREIVRSVQA